MLSADHYHEHSNVSIFNAARQLCCLIRDKGIEEAARNICPEDAAFCPRCSRKQ